MKIMLTVAFVIALGTMTVLARPLAANTLATHVADAIGAEASAGSGIAVIYAGPELTSTSWIVSVPMAEPEFQFAPRDMSISRAPPPIAVVAVGNPFRAGDEVLDFRDGDRPLIQKAGSSGFPTFPCRDASEMLTHGLMRGSIPAARVTAAASLVNWCKEQHDARLGAGKDVAAAVEPTSLVGELADDSTTVEEQLKLIPRHVGQCGRSEL